MSRQRLLLLCLACGLAAWGALALLILLAPPTAGAVLVALALTAIAVAFTTVPLWMRVQQRLFTRTPAQALPRLALRQGIWAGVYVSALLGLHIYRSLDGALALALLALFALLERFLQERSAWGRPDRAEKTPPPAPAPAGGAYQRTRKTSPPKEKPDKSAQKSKLK